MKFRIAKKIMTGRSSYLRRCRELRPMAALSDGRVYGPDWSGIDRIRRARKVCLHHMRRYLKD